MIDKLIKEFPRAIIICFSIYIIFVLIDFLMNASENLTPYQSGYYIGIFTRDHFFNLIFYSMILYFINSALYKKLNEYYGTENYRTIRIIIGFLSSFVISVVVFFLLRIFKNVLIEGTSFLYFIKNETLASYFVTIIITFFVTLTFHAFYFYKALQETKVKEQKIIATTANAQFESLKNQIDPHFLFNSLNVLSSLIEENPENAQKFTTSLSKIYRYVLEQKDKELVAVEEELAFAKIYMQLLEMRFENSISYELPESINEDAKVVPLSLQLLLENCIKHNVVSSSKPLHIKISIDNNQLIVENNWQKKEVLSDGKGVGLQNIVNRYALLTERKVKITNNEESFKVHLPILTKQISIMKTTNFIEENNAYLRAKKRVEELKGFYINLTSYCIVIPTSAIINYNIFWGFQWFWFPMLGWGLGLTFHAFGVFGYGKSWEERKIQELIKQDKSSNWN